MQGRLFRPCIANHQKTDMKNLVFYFSLIALTVSLICMNFLAITASLIPFFSAFIPELYDGAKDEMQ